MHGQSARHAPSVATHLQTREVADLLHVSPKTVSRWAQEGRLPFRRTLGGHRRYPEAHIRQLAASLTVEPKGVGA
jgi:excisionase family DNA binding protein